MIIGTVIGNVWSTRKIEALVGLKFLVVETDRGEIVACDNIGAGEGDKVLITQGSSARQETGDSIPIDALIIGIIDK